MAAVAEAKGYSKILLLGTSFAFNRSLNPNAFANVDAELLLSNQSEQAFVHSTIVNELISGVVTEQAKDTMKLLINKYQQAGANAVILGCTELPLIINAQLSALAILDSTTILGGAVIQAAKSSGLCISSAWLLASCSRLST
ncbi:hypothetical protein GCM10007414_29530 [Agarivorans gilvus]|uniref:Aspartate racemase n=1 Tax=Agarivorans gilvus TaxID=680279 RepID=A0ABQ1I4G1_9ALTE|nr:hypothetical protein GCM10007414_29530 [Agarivorans gilvus]